MFALDPVFPAATDLLGDLALSHARLQRDARYPWIMLIPRREGLVDLTDLTAAERGVLVEEIAAASHAVRAVADALGQPILKVNVGQLGNLTPQLHIHVLGRRAGDPAWPGPVWGHSPAQDYEAEALATAVAAARASLGL